MAVANGYGKVVTSGSVFMYDVGDTRNSYRGEPTVNAFGTYPTDLYGWTTSGNACTLSRDTIQSPVGNTPLKMVTTGNDAYTGTYASSYWNITAASSGQTWTISVWAKANQNTVGQIFHFGANSSGNIIDFNAIGISLTTEWTRYSYTRTFTDGNVVAIQTRLDGADTFQSGDIIWWDGLQVEQKPNPTQFTTGTRSSTQGLLSLVGNSTFDLSYVSFDSNAQMIFDGTNDYVPITLSTSIGVYCLEMVWYNNNAIPNNDTVIGGPTTYQTPIEFNGNGSGVHLGAWTGGMTNEAIHIWGGGGATSNRVAAAVGYHHVVFNWNGTTYDIWVDGVNTTTYYQNGTTPAGLITATSIKLGRDVDNYCFNGQIPVTKIYNRALSAAEVRQNYNKYKTRFNLP